MYCFATVGKVTLVLAALAVFGWTPVLAQESEPPLVVAASIDIPAAQIPLTSVGLRDIPTEAGEAKPRRPKALIPLYATFASLQVLDVHSTTRALDRGAVEANPVMKRVVSSPAGMLALKAGATTAIVYAGERIWRRNKATAVLFMIAANSAMGWVVQHNYRAVR